VTKSPELCRLSSHWIQSLLISQVNVVTSILSLPIQNKTVFGVKLKMSIYTACSRKNYNFNVNSADANMTTN
jgi:hypothetical protein